MIEKDNEVTEKYEYKRRNNWSFKQAISCGLLVAVLLYGSGFLVNSFASLVHERYLLQTTHKVADFRFPVTSDKKIFGLEMLRNESFRPVTHSIQWLSSGAGENDMGRYVEHTEEGYLVKSMLDDEYKFNVLNSSVIRYQNKMYIIEDVIASDDLSLALVITDKKHNWRHSFFANYWVYNTENGDVQPLYDADMVLNSEIAVAKWSPTSKMISFVLNNNVYVKDLHDFYHPSIQQVTFDGGAECFYGKPDWVYEEEVFESDSAMWWSPEGHYLAILRLNDTQVPEFSIPYFVQPNHDPSYPELRKLKYPKAGYANPVVDIVVLNVESGQVAKLKENDIFYNDADLSNEQRLITEVVWVGPKEVLVKVTNRASDVLKYFLIDSQIMSSTIARDYFAQGDDRNGWFEIDHNILYVPKDEGAGRIQDGYIDTIDIDGFNHLALFSPVGTSTPKVLTRGDWEVVDAPSAFDFKTNTVYFMATKKSSIERHLYSVQIDGSRLTNLTNTADAGWFSASFSSGARFVLLNYQGPDIPYQTLIDLNKDSRRIIEDNAKLVDALADVQLPRVRYGEVEVSNGVYANFMETLPLEFDETKRYPLLFFVYGGPGSQQVSKRFQASFSSVVAAQADAVVVTVDGRGTGFKGKEFRNIVRDRLGRYEVNDQISTGKIWADRSYVDESRTAIWGWSYGGFMTLKTMEVDAGETFKYGVSVAPVTQWSLYDSVYTERYMHTPQSNAQGYREASIYNVTQIGKVERFLLMHGTGDDNVHLQNSLKLLDLLNMNGIENYDMMVFPDSDHSISFHNANKVVYDKILNWLKHAFAADSKRGLCPGNPVS